MKYALCNDCLCRLCYVEVKKRVKILEGADDYSDDEYFDAIEDAPVTVKELTLPQRPKR